MRFAVHPDRMHAPSAARGTRRRTRTRRAWCWNHGDRTAATVVPAIGYSAGPSRASSIGTGAGPREAARRRATAPDGSKIASDHCTIGPIASANTTVPSPTVPPRRNPTTSTVKFEARPRSPDREAEPVVETRHQAVPRAGAEIGGQVKARRDADRHDAERHHRELRREVGRRRQERQGGVRGNADQDDVENGSDARLLPKRQPHEQDRDAQDDRHGPERDARLARDALVEHLPRTEPLARRRHQRNPDAEQQETDEQLRQLPRHRPREPAITHRRDRNGPQARSGTAAPDAAPRAVSPSARCSSSSWAPPPRSPAPSSC